METGVGAEALLILREPLGGECRSLPARSDIHTNGLRNLSGDASPR